MKKLSMVLLLALVATVSFGQIQVLEVNKTPKVTLGKIKSGLAFVAEMEYEANKSDTLYTLSFRDYKYQQITSIRLISFNSDSDAFNSFYSICKSVFNDENRKNKDYSVTFKLGGETILVANYKMMGMTYVQIFDGTGMSTPLTESQLNKLFGKS
jgi:hypothetical protein